MDEEVLDENLAAKGQHRFFKNEPFYIWGAILLAGLLLYVVRGPFQSLFILIGSAGLTSYSLHGFFIANERIEEVCALKGHFVAFCRAD